MIALKLIFPLDYVVLLISVLFILFSAWKGFIQSILALMTWVGSIIITLFVILPPSPVIALIFGALMGLLWLATVPLTNGVILTFMGPKYLATLGGIVFLSHQIGSFVGVWLGGLFYDIYGSYNIVWWVGIGVGAFSAIIHLPIKEEPIERRRLLTT